MNILHHSIFAPNPWGHGGEKRTTQLQEYFRTQGLEVIELNVDLGSLSLGGIWGALLLLLRTYGLHSFRSPYKFLRTWYHTARRYNNLIRAFSRTDFDEFHWESVREEWYILCVLARRHGKKVIAYPHNLESLVTNHRSVFRWDNHNAFRHELNIYRQCARVSVISFEESWLLALYGVSAVCFPYHLPQVVENSCLHIAEQRKSADKNFYLLLGTAINPPTRMGMEEILCAWQSSNLPLVVAGYGTETLTDYACEHIRVLGTVDNDMLAQLQTHAIALVIYQPATTGALTRIEEAIVAQLPVYTNPMGMRHYQGNPSVTCYQDIPHLMSMLA
ncbi:MAG: glycosyltransferase family 4 protein [Paludibacter sp.]|nr:glycosyltransferase family 4 protein [Bacteroidales bacterium]MCM1069081.1 glycosyltransferase family 4 protein [Prevotella sp.]MCM1353520.1 glycosyltransferase family 4 protein [Bacteroides sp.]MCM1442681.1 glycosyltransferase family 4 protein [Muribaculum sp.]MCM1481683.1 glycosyltransferase family 4 protein [Paludibacter sp.]